MSSQKDPSESLGLKERWDRLDQREKVHEVEGRWIEDESWAIAKALSDRNEDGESQRVLAATTGRGAGTVSRWIGVHRRFGSIPPLERPSFGEARDIVTHGSVEERRDAMRQSGERRGLRPEAIARALERPELAKAVKAAMSPAARVEMLPDPIVEPVLLSEIEPEEAEEPEPESETEAVDDEPARNVTTAPSGQLRSWEPKPPTNEKLVERVHRNLTFVYATLGTTAELLSDLELDDEQREYVLDTVRKTRGACEAIERRLSPPKPFLGLRRAR
jgi:hypothetical protein